MLPSRFKAIFRIFLRRSSSRSCSSVNSTSNVPEHSNVKIPDLASVERIRDSQCMSSHKLPAVERPTSYRRASSVSFVSIPTLTRTLH
ncbi:hypothetical protein R3P38DRAFT_3037022 [Favolaschia claudopus]|uniref:Secreted protein n=1 Tax=Favolaschia claudopus TaxID=2862362 RepID=A0AAW0AAW4_9AGAR